MKRLFILFALFFTFSTVSYAKEKCVACVTAKQRAIVQKKLDDLRARVKELEAENKFLREEAARPQAVAESPRAAYPVAAPVEVKTSAKKNRISALAGIGPDSLTNRRKDARDGNEIAITSGPQVGLQYQRLLGDTISLGAIVTTPTRPETKEISYLGSIGVDF